MDVCIYVMWDVFDCEGKIIGHFEEELTFNDNSDEFSIITIHPEKQINDGEMVYFCKINSVQVLKF